ncbi:MAG TPA: hypothetical protein DC047_09525 [Blastocatellia bacterium]|nr:hypothetical protein [Blastocatellia bacterium]
MTVLEHIKQLALNLTPEEKDALAQHLAGSNGENPPEKPQSLRGDWGDAFSDDLDVDAELKGIRGEWQKEWLGDEFVG